ncbi:hypothetical protein SNEBB_000043 [Seison nebaliae]|nr:hypothetical protein SNEBB_000043 [Seison nebaliae]
MKMSLPFTAHSSNGRQDEMDDLLEVEDISFGKFQWLLLVICGIANSSDAVEMLCISFILPIIECDLNINSTMKGYLITALFLGMMCGSFIWGSLADIYGRKRILIIAMIFNTISALASTFPNDFYLFTFIRFLAGLGVGGSIPIVWAYYGEYLPSNKRGQMLCLLAASWMVGSIFVAGLGWLLLPYEYIGALKSWRLFMGLCSIPTFLSAITFALLPESPMFIERRFIVPNHIEQIYELVARFNATNSFGIQKSLLVRMNRMSHQNYDKKETKGRNNNYLESVMKLKEVLVPPFIRPTIIMIILVFATSYSSYGLGMWFPQIFKLMELTGKSPCSHFNITIPVNETCRATTEEFKDSLISVTAALPGNLFSIFFIDRFGRKALMVTSFILSGLSVIGIPFITRVVYGITLASIFQGITTIIFNAIDCLQVELFPTQIRTTAIGFVLIFMRIGAIGGNFTFAALIDTYCTIPLLLVGLMCGIGAFVSLFIRDTTLIKLK